MSNKFLTAKENISQNNEDVKLERNGKEWKRIFRIHTSWTGEIIIITGIHNLGLKFSKFIFFYFRQLFEIFDYKEVSSLTTLKDDRLKLAFQEDRKLFDIKKLMD